MEKIIYLKEVLDEQGRMQSFVAEKLNVSRALVNLWVKDKAYPTIKTLKELSELLEVDVKILLYGKDEWIEGFKDT
jgi:transcriptional regulator with XRE-family HTH domain